MSIDQLLGLATGVIFGFLLQKGRVLRYDKQVAALLLKDMTGKSLFKQFFKEGK